MPDHRTRRQKMEDVLKPNSGASNGERANARSLLAKMDAKAKPVRVYLDGVDVTERVFGYVPPKGPEAQPAGRTARPRNWPGYDDFVSQWEEQLREDLRKAKARETLQREYGFVMSDDPGFESEYTYQAGNANATFRRASQTMDDISDRLSKMSTEEIIELFSRHTGGTRGSTEREPR